MDITVNFTRDIIYNLVCSAEDSVLGDLNEDSVVNVQDIIIMVNIILGDEYNEAADLSGDGIINILDVIQLVNLILGE